MSVTVVLVYNPCCSVVNIFWTLILTAMSPVFLDDAEVQRQKMVPVLIRDWCKRPLAHMDSPWPPPICLFVHQSLQAFFTGTFAIFLPSTMLNTVLTSVLGWNWGVDREGKAQREKKKCPFLCSHLFVSLNPAPGESLSFAKMSFIVGLPNKLELLNPRNAEKRHTPNHANRLAKERCKIEPHHYKQT